MEAESMMHESVLQPIPRLREHAGANLLVTRHV